MTYVVARRPMSVDGSVLSPGDALPADVVARIPRIEALVRTGFVKEVPGGDPVSDESGAGIERGGKTASSEGRRGGAKAVSTAASKRRVAGTQKG